MPDVERSDADPAVRHVALIGLSGTGKSTVAPLLAARLGTARVDIDEQVERRYGTDVATVFAEEGEPTFREAEHEALVAALDGDRSVVATGGGIVVDERNRDLLRARSVVVWLAADVSEIVVRLTRSSATRPLLAADPETALRRLADEREPLYRDVADVVVDVTEQRPHQVVEQIAAMLASAGGIQVSDADASSTSAPGGSDRPRQEPT